MTLVSSGSSSAGLVAAAAVLSAASLFHAGAARADVPPPPGYVEQCTIAQQQSAQTVCEACDTYYAEAQKCVTHYASTPFQKRCQSQGASVWTEVWCRPRTPADSEVAGTVAPPAPPPAAPPPAARPAAATAQTTATHSDSCSVTSAGAPGHAHAAPWLSVAALLVLSRARRRGRARRNYRA